MTVYKLGPLMFPIEALPIALITGVQLAVVFGGLGRTALKNPDVSWSHNRNGISHYHEMPENYSKNHKNSLFRAPLLSQPTFSDGIFYRLNNMMTKLQ